MLHQDSRTENFTELDIIIHQHLLIFVMNLIAVPRGADSADEQTGVQPIIGSVSSMQSEIWFKVSAGDTITGTTMYEVASVPRTRYSAWFTYSMCECIWYEISQE